MPVTLDSVTLTLLHLGNEVLVEQAASLLVQGAVDGDNVTLGQHLLEVVDATAANLLLNLRGQGLVVVVKQLLAVEWLKTAQDTLTDTTNSDGTDNLALEVILILGGASNVPLTGLDHLVGGDKVTDEDQDGHENVLGNRDDVGAGNLSDSDTAIGLVCGVQVDVVGTDTSSDGELELLGASQPLSRKVSRVEAALCCQIFVGFLLNVSGCKQEAIRVQLTGW